MNPPSFSRPIRARHPVYTGPCCGAIRLRLWRLLLVRQGQEDARPRADKVLGPILLLRLRVVVCHRQARLSSPHPPGVGLLNTQVTGLIVGQAHQGHWPYRLVSSPVVVRPGSGSSTRIALAWRVPQHHGVDWRGGADSVEHRRQHVGMYRPGSEDDHRPRRFRHGDRELADVGIGFQRDTAQFADRADRLNLGVGFARFCRVPYLQRQNQCSAYIFAGNANWRLAETVTCFCEVDLVRFVEHNPGRQELNERSVPSFVPAALCDRCGFPELQRSTVAGPALASRCG